MLEDGEFNQLRRQVHLNLIRGIEAEGAFNATDPEVLRQRVVWALEEIEEATPLTLVDGDRDRLFSAIQDEMLGFGPLAPLMLDGRISDVLVNGPDNIWVDRSGQLERVDLRFDDEAQLRRVVNRIISAEGHHLDQVSPMVDLRLPDGSRLHAVIPPLTRSGMVLSIRRFRLIPFSSQELLDAGFLDSATLELLELLVSSGTNMLISGGASAGKTTLLNLMAGFIPGSERVVTIEDTGELRLDHPHVISLESKAANSEGYGEVSVRDVLRGALRMRADRIIVGEVRGAEVFDMLQAMNIGHDGSLATIHANSPEDVLPRLVSLVASGNVGLDRHSVKDMIKSAIRVVVHLTRYNDGTRRITSIREVLSGAEGLVTQELVGFCLNANAQPQWTISESELIGQLRAVRQGERRSPELAVAIDNS